MSEEDIVFFLISPTQMMVVISLLMHVYIILYIYNVIIYTYLTYKVSKMYVSFFTKFDHLNTI